MKTLATAYPNQEYDWFSSIKSLKIEARWTGERILFFENSDLGEKQLGSDTVKSLFRTDVIRRCRPFLIKDNPTFAAVLYRDRQAYKSKFKNLLKSENHDELKNENTQPRRFPRRADAPKFRRTRERRK